MTEATILQEQSEKVGKDVEAIIMKCENTYLNPETAKKMMIIKRQFKEERERIGR